MKARRGKSGSAARAVGAAGLRARLERTEERLREVEERHRLAMAAIRESVYDYDVLRDSIYYSDSMQRELGLPPGTLRTPQDWRDRIHPDDWLRYHEAFVAHLKGATGRFVCDYRYRGGDGTWRWARQHGLAVRDKKGRALRVVGSTGDITDLKRAEEALEQVRARYDLALRAIHEGVYEWDIESGTAYYSERLYDVLKLSPGDLQGPMDWRSRIHPEDLPYYDAGLVAHFKGQTERFECEYRYKARDGSWRWARQHGLAVRDANGRAVRMTGSTGDITDLKQAQEALRTSEERYARATEAAVEGIYEWDIVAGRLFLTERAKEFFSLSGEELTPAAWNVRVHAEDYPRYRAAIVEHFKARTPQLEIEYRIADASGGYRWVLDRGKAVRDSHGGAIKMVGALSDITQRKRVEIELRRARDEATEALEQQVATSEVLAAMNASPGDAGAVYRAILENATRLCQASFAALFLYDGEFLKAAAHHAATAEFAKHLDERHRQPGPGTATGLAALERRIVHVVDLLEDPDFHFADGDVHRTEGVRTVLAVPILREGALVGVIAIWRRERRRFTDKHVALVKTFADQAVIAIENVRLFNETKEALEQQTATANVLRVISGSLTDLAPVFDTILDNAVRLCEGNTAVLWRFDGEVLRFAAHKNGSAKGVAYLQERPLALGDYNPTPQAGLERRTIHVLDVFAEPRYRPLVPPDTHRTLPNSGTVLAVPLLKDDRLLGVITIWRFEKRMFSDKQVAMVSTFAAQAVIAIENVRLFNETKEALEQQTATAEILKVISNSPTDVQPVFDAIVRSAAELFAPCKAVIVMREGDRLQWKARAEASQPRADLEELAQLYPLPFDPRQSVSAQAILERRVIQIPDTEAPGVAEAARLIGRAAKHRSVTVVPLLREGEGIGTIGIQHPQAGFALNEKQLALLRTFADQAVIAIENVRLFNETKEALEQQTATAEILKVMSGSLTDIQPVVDVVAATAARLCEADDVLIQMRDGDLMRSAAHHGSIPVAATRPVSPKLLLGRVVDEGQQIQLDDTQKEDQQYPESAESARRLGYHTMLHTPLMRAGKVIGIITMRRTEVKPFNEKQKALVKTFADQAVIAIENVRLFNETKEALDQQKASAEVLRVISESVADTKPVFDAILESCERLFEGQDVGINLVGEDGLIHVAAYRGPGREAFEKHMPVPLSMDSGSGAAILQRRVLHYADLERGTDVPAYLRRGAALQGNRSMIVAPMMWKDEGIGVVFVGRSVARPFTEKEIALLKTFADQAAIAIENVRLFNETKEALQQQTAVSEVLRAIASSPADVGPVFEKILDNAVRLCDKPPIGAVFRYDGELLHLVATKNMSPEAQAAMRARWPSAPDPRLVSGRTILTRQVVRMEDNLADPDYDPSLASIGGWRRMLGVPMIKDGLPVGAFVVSWTAPGPIADGQVELLKTFADQAVIAIENVRLFNETNEALEQQTATAEILKVMSGSLTDIQPVVDVVAATAARLCEADDVLVLLRDAEVLRTAAHHGTIPVLPARPLSPKLLAGRVVREGRQIQVEDLQKEDEQYPESAESARQRGFHTILHTPLMRAGEVIGMITMRRTEVKPFNEKQKALVKTFADQAVIAIENVRLFNETKEALERQTATSEVLKVISQTRIDLEPVLEIVLKNARRLCGADQAVIFRADDEGNCVPASLQVTERANEILEFYRQHPIRPNRGSATGRAMVERRAIHIADVLTDSEYRMEYATNRNYRSILAVPMLREGSPIGVLTVTRVGEPRPFTDKQIELVTSFADQAVIAIENVRLFNETTEALEQQKALAEVLRVISSSVADTKPVFDTILESCQRLFEGHIVGITTVGEDGAIHLAAYQGPKQEEFARHFPVPATLESGSGAAIQQASVLHYPDMEAPDVPEYARRGSRFTGTGSCIFAPMLWEGQGIGAIFAGRQSKGPFSDKDIGLLKTFADQAVIAIQNARLFREINEKSRQVEIANRHKSEFLANMSHELRTPLNAIIGFTRIVMRRAKEQLEPKQYENLEKIHSSGQHLLQLINAILDLSKVEAGRVEVNAADVALGTVLEQCVKTVEPLVKAPAVRLLKDFDGGLPQVYVDEEKLRQIVINLLSNAVKFTERGTVRVRAECKGDGFSVAVADTGIGIPAEKLEHVFEEFAQADASSTRVYGGTGLGLTIARRLARLMGGDISAQSEPGVGSTFTLKLPVRYQALAEVRPRAPAQAQA